VEVEKASKTETPYYLSKKRELGGEKQRGKPRYAREGKGRGKVQSLRVGLEKKRGEKLLEHAGKLVRKTTLMGEVLGTITKKNSVRMSSRERGGKKDQEWNSKIGYLSRELS